jgi:carbamoyltransferase
VTEEILLKMAQAPARETGMKNLCLAGGVALNSVANYKLLRDGPFEDVYVHPRPATTAAVWARRTGRTTTCSATPAGPALEHAYLGSEHSDAEIEAFLRKYDIPYRKFDDDEASSSTTPRKASSTATSAAGCAAASSGARAPSGARSIIADPRRPR